MSHPPVVVVDSKDKVIDWAPLPKAWSEGLAHRIVYVVIQDKDDRLLLHRRAKDMVLYPGCWDTVGGHVDVTPDYEESARIELREEAGIDDAILEEIAYFYSDEPYSDGKLPKRFIKIFKTHHNGDPGNTNEEEVAETKWFTLKELDKLVKAHPQDIAIGLKFCLPFIMEGYEDYQNIPTGQTKGSLLNLR
jgi:8-oxo-dGTP pyrophosphatase MutT (NUDIX family)